MKRDNRALVIRIILAVGGPGILLLAALLTVAAVIAGGAVAQAGASCGAPTGSVGLVDTSLTEEAQRDIPADYLAIYQAAGRDIDIDWHVLASIGKQESNHGRSTLPGVHSGQNAAGAAGPMQLGNGTGEAGDYWLVFRLDGNGDGVMSVYDPWDAIYAAANGLRRAKHAPPRGGSYADYKTAAGNYYGSHTAGYSSEVMARAVRYGFTAPDVPQGESPPLDAGTFAVAHPDPAPLAGTSAADLDAWMARKVSSSPLVGMGQDFVDAGVSATIDPRLLVAIAYHESALGTAASGAARKNAFSLGPGNTYPTWRAGIEAAARRLRNYTRDGIATLDDIQARWAPAGAATDSNNLDASWRSGVTRALVELGANPDAGLAGDAATGYTSASDTTGAGCVGGDLSGVRGRIVTILQEEYKLGLRESGENAGPPLERYWGSNGIPWCAAFATWVWRKAGVPIPAHAYSGYFAQWARAHGTWKPLGVAPPEPGDAVVWTDGDGDGRTDHVDIVEQVLPSGQIIVIGGNVQDTVARTNPMDPATARHGNAPILGFASPITAPQETRA